MQLFSDGPEKSSHILLARVGFFPGRNKMFLHSLFKVRNKKAFGEKNKKNLFLESGVGLLVVAGVSNYWRLRYSFHP